MTPPRFTAALLGGAFALLAAATPQLPAAEPPIDREALVKRHNPTATKLDPLSPFTVGNGGFAFTADITGLQTFPAAYEKGIPLHTESQWGWHSFPNPQGYKLEDAFQMYDVHGRKVAYAGGEKTPAGTYLRENPHRLDLARIGLILKKADGADAQPADLTDIKQTLDEWSGVLTSEFKLEGQPVLVRTACHPERDLLAVEIESSLLTNGQVSVMLAFPGAKATWKENADWEHPDAHKTVARGGDRQRCSFVRTLDDTRYFAAAKWSGNVRASQESGAFAEPSDDLHPPKNRLPRQARDPHRVEFTAPSGDKLSLVCEFSPKEIGADLPDPAATFQASADHWKKFWQTGGAIDLSGSTDPRWMELERRIVLSQYLTAAQCANDMPPQETGLTFNSWFGKPHTEMHWWHGVHFALWGRPELLEKSLPWYDKIMPVAQALAKRQGYTGARWPKMVGPNGEESPSKVAAFLVWEQPHPIYLAELARRAHPDKQTLEKYKNIVFETAEFMASYAWWDEPNKRYVLGPGLIPAQECYNAAKTMNPTYELAYWHWALKTAQTWREQLGLPREEKWDHVADNMSKPTVREGVYTAVETEPYTETHDHPSMLGALGMLPLTPLIDPAIMGKTYDNVLQVWQWKTTWGWDYPMMAMTAARLGRPEAAIDALFMDAQKNTYLPNGHNYQDDRLTLYLPGNGGVLAAVAMMAAGWDGAPVGNAPGFPADKWRVRWEGLKPMP